MTNLPLKLPAEYWQNFSVTSQDIDYLQNYLFDTETPQTPLALTKVLVVERIRLERDAQSKAQKNSGTFYIPKDNYQVGEKLIFSALGFKLGTVASVRPGNNPDVGLFSVLEVTFEDGNTCLFAANLIEHKLNLPPVEKTDPESDQSVIMSTYGTVLEKKLDKALRSDENLVRIAGAWFPRALLIDINMGHLNLAEAVLEMNSGEPMTTSDIIEQVDVPRDSNTKLTEFSVNYALQEDGRFDEVGAIGEVQWYLKRLEPDEVQNIPSVLKYIPVDYDRSVLNDLMFAIESQLDDELSETEHKPIKSNDATITLTYPHWRAGTLPISSRVEAFFPTALESPRIRFTIVDGKTGEKMPAWVVREYGYVFGLRKWYEKQKLIPGAYLIVRRSKNPGEVILEAKTHRPNRDWVRTVLAGSDGGLVFAVLKQEISCEYNERMALVISDVSAVDASFKQIVKNHLPIEILIRNILKELAKLTPQGHVHAEELYSAVNILRRIPPAPLLAILASHKGFVHVGDLHFRLADNIIEDA
ncbi:MAG: hypothetical protein NTW32_24100 [Chloroflexi bacterium]|nr:hypothetical protein [Chloroflexota bacterium]